LSSDPPMSSFLYLVRRNNDHLGMPFSEKRVEASRSQGKPFKCIYSFWCRSWKCSSVIKHLFNVCWDPGFDPQYCKEQQPLVWYNIHFIYSHSTHESKS
jgi:hypothetical protein